MINGNYLKMKMSHNKKKAKSNRNSKIINLINKENFKVIRAKNILYLLIKTLQENLNTIKEDNFLKKLKKCMDPRLF